MKETSTTSASTATRSGWFRLEGGKVIVSAFPNGEEYRPAMYELEVSHEEAAELGGLAYGEEG